MAVRIYGHHFEIKEPFKSYIESKLPRLEKYTDQLQQLDITLEQDGPNTLAELRMKAGQMDVNVKHKDADPAKAVDRLVDKAERALKKQHDLMKNRRKKAVAELQEMKKANFSPDAEPVELINTDGPSLGTSSGNGRAHPRDLQIPELHEKLGVRIFRSPKTSVGDLTVQEAAEELFFRDENFLCFTDADTDELSIIYRRKDGNFALMQTGDDDW